MKESGPSPSQGAARVVAGAPAATEAGPDYSVFSLIAANLFAIAAAYWFRLSLLQIILVYWSQSVIIGVSSVIRILAVRDASQKYNTAMFFVLHYGFFHVGYLVFLAIYGVNHLQPIHLGGEVGICALVFALHQAYSLWNEIPCDRRSRIGIDALFWMPYPRILPMHCIVLVILSGTAEAKALPLFLALKTLADVIMHMLERRFLRKRLEIGA